MPAWTGLWSLFGSGSGTQSSRRNLQFIVALVDCVLTVSSLAVCLGTVFGITALADMEIIDGAMLKSILSLICPVVTMTQFASPAPVVLEALRKLDVQNLPIPVMVSQAACNMLGTAYGLRVRNEVVLGSNMFGLGCQTVFLAANHYVTCGNGHWIGFSVQIQAIYCIALYICVEVVSLNVLGQIITLFNLILFAIPLTKLGTILKSKNATSLPMAMTVVSFASNALWSLYGLLIKDMVVTLPSVLGYILCAFQVLVLLWCHNKLPFDLGFLLLPCRSTKPIPKKVVSIAEDWSSNEENPEVTSKVSGSQIVSDLDI
jgi:solute carrier family 50 protein (sugar transporter)